MVIKRLWNVLSLNLNSIKEVLGIAVIGGSLNGLLQKIPRSIVDTPFHTWWGYIIHINNIFFFYSGIAISTALIVYFPLFTIICFLGYKNESGNKNIIRVIKYFGLALIILTTSYLCNINTYLGWDGFALTKRLLLVSLAVAIVQVLLLFIWHSRSNLLRVLLFLFPISCLIYVLYFTLMPLIGANDFYRDIHSNRPSIIVLVEDAMNTRYLSLYSSTDDITPNITYLGVKSTVFSNCIAQSSWTLPSVSSMWTGLPPGAIAVSSNQPYLLHDTLPEVLSRNGYETYAVVCNPLLSNSFKYSKGFDNYYHIDEERLVDFGLDMPYGYNTGWERALNKAVRLVTGVFHNRLRSIQWNLCLKVLKKVPKSGCFVYLHLMETHLPYDPPDRFRENESDYRGRFERRVRVQELSMYRDGKLVIDDEVEREHIRELYRAEVRCADYILGEMVNILKSRGIFDEVIFIFTSDHGEEHWEHGGFEHGHSVHREVVGVPLIIHLPHKDDGMRIESQVRLMDIFPTILEITRIHYDGEILAESLLPSMINKRSHLPAISEKLLYGAQMVSYRDGEYTYILNLENGDDYLYNDFKELVELNDEALKNEMSLYMEKYLAQEGRIRDRILKKTLYMKGEVDEEYIKESLRSLGYIQ